MKLLRILTVLLVAGCARSPVLEPPSTPSSITAVVAYSGTPGWLLDEPIQVLVRDDAGTPLSEVLVTWSTQVAGAWLDQASSLSDEDGIARIGFAPGWATGTQQVRATVGQLSADVPVSVTSFEAVQTASITWGRSFICAIGGEGQLGCWPALGAPGAFDEPVVRPEELRPGFATESRRYRQVKGTGASVSTGRFCALSDIDELWCWGDVEIDAQNVPHPVKWDTPVPFGQIAVAAGSAQATVCGLSTGGHAWCRGGNDRGQVGDGSTITRDQFVPVMGAVQFRSVAARPGQFCGVDMTGLAWCWGDNLTVPTRVGGDDSYAIVAPMANGVCGARAVDGVLMCWGNARVRYFDGTGAQLPDGLAAAAVIGHPTAAELGAGSGIGMIRTVSGQVSVFGDLIHDIIHTDDHLKPSLHPSLSSGISGLLSDYGDYWCVEHASGATLCGHRISRAVGLPAN